MELAASPALESLAEAQDGVLSRRQLRELGVHRETVRQALRARRWQRVHPGVYATFTGPLLPRARIWAAVLYAGEEAMASHRTAAWLQELEDELPDTLDVTVPHGHRHRGSRATVRVRQSRHARDRMHPAASPPQSRLDDTVLDLADDTRRPERVLTIVLRATQRRLTSAQRLRQRAHERRRVRWRALLEDLLADVDEGVQSALERRYLRDVERPHGLPAGERNEQEGVRGRRRYRDVRYQRWRLVVELDGRAAHPEETRELDHERDLELVLSEDVTTVRLGWRSVAGKPCQTAARVARLLQRRGWSGDTTRCGPDCAVDA